MNSRSSRPHIILVIPRGEAVRNFLYSDTLPTLSENARVTLLSVIHDDEFVRQFSPYVERIIPLCDYTERRIVVYLRTLLHNAHFRWLWSGVARNRAETFDAEMTTLPQKTLRALWKSFVWMLANRPSLSALTALERKLTLVLRPTHEFDDLWDELKPDLVFNTSHIHGNASSLPMRVAYSKGYQTAGFIFSWDNLTSRSRIYVPYHHYLVWHQHMCEQLLEFYHDIVPYQVHITGTPQFDFHFKAENWLTREELAEKIGFDPKRPFVFYTTGIDRHFPDEHRTVELVVRLLRDMPQKPQLVVRNYVKGTSEAMRAVAKAKHSDVFFPSMQWDHQWFMPTKEDQRIYTSLLRECALGINAASTVSLELMLHHKPVINLGFNPPGSQLPHHLYWTRHTDEFDHYIPVTNSRAVMMARSESDLESMITRALKSPEEVTAKQPEFLNWMFDDSLDGQAGKRVAEALLRLADKEHRKSL